MPGLEIETESGLDHLSSASTNSLARQAIRTRLTSKAAAEWNAESKSTANGNSCDSVRKFTWKELSQLHQSHNAHVAYRGKVCLIVASYIARRI